MRLGAVIVTHAQPELAVTNARKVGDDIGRDAVIVVVNDASALDEATRADLEAAAGTVIVNERFLGYGENLNLGVRALDERCDSVLLLNDDAFPRPGAIAGLAAALERDPGAALAGPSIVDPQGAPQPAAFRFPSVRSETVAYLLLPGALQARALRRYAIAEPSKPERVDWVLGAAMLARRDAYESVGGFDPHFFLYSEETDLARRLLDRGWASIHVPDAVFEHIGAVSTNDHGLMMASRGRYLRRHWPARRRVALAVTLTAAGAWNVAYSSARALAAPSTADVRWQALRQRRKMRRALWSGS